MIVEDMTTRLAGSHGDCARLVNLADALTKDDDAPSLRAVTPIGEHS
jgi:hypothetical protein